MPHFPRAQYSVRAWASEAVWQHEPLASLAAPDGGGGGGSSEIGSDGQNWLRACYVPSCPTADGRLRICVAWVDSRASFVAADVLKVAFVLFCFCSSGHCICFCS